jgi:hypothetical protein
MDNPNQGLFDILTRRDELQIKTNQLLEQILAKNGGSATVYSGGLSADLITRNKQLETGQIVPYRLITIPMDTAGTDVPFTVVGDNLVAFSDGTLMGTTIKFGNTNFDAVPIYYVIGKKIPTSKIFVSWVAQSGKKLYILSGYQGIAQFDLNPIYASNVGSTAPEVLYSDMPGATVFSLLADCRNTKRLVIDCESTLDAAIQIQPVGSLTNSAISVRDLGLFYPVADGSATTQAISFDISDTYWRPFIGVQIIITGVPTSGTLTITSVKQV